MARLWQIHVQELGRNWVHVEVQQAHPDSGPFPDDDDDDDASPLTFALRVLHEPAWELDAEFQERPLGALGAACTSRQILNEDWVTANVARFIAKVEAQPASAATLDETSAQQLIATRLGLPMDNFDQLSESDRARLDDAYCAFWKDYAHSNLPSRSYRITVTDPAFLTHLTAGAQWPSAAFA
jgi:hypothetical protein